MLKFQGKEYRNLEEQVQKNKEDIARHYEIDRALANLGIKVIGQVELPSQLPDPLTYTGEYGDTYAVGNPEEVAAGTGVYEYYVFTRPDENAGVPNDHWLNVGRISIVGPQGIQGIQGPQGPKGERGNRWCVGTAPTISNPKTGDMWLSVSQNHEEAGKVYTYNGYSWVEGTNIRGPQGIQGARGPAGPQGEAGPAGPEGPAGDVGGFINIWGILSNASQLPNPATLSNLTVAYLVGTTPPYDLYVQIGKTSETAVWENTGPFNAATAVSVEGIFQNVWNADTKLDKKTGTTSQPQVYVKNRDGTQTEVDLSNNATINGSIVQRAGFDVIVPDDPAYETGAVNKKYVRNSFAPKNPPTTGQLKIWVSNGNAGFWNIIQNNDASASAGNIPIYAQNESWGQTERTGRLLTATPTQPYQAANKAYVDNNTSVPARVVLWDIDDNKLIINTVVKPDASTSATPYHITVAQGLICTYIEGTSKSIASITALDIGDQFEVIKAGSQSPTTFYVTSAEVSIDVE